MSSSVKTYRILLDKDGDSGTTRTCTPRWDGSLNRVSKQESGQVFHRDTIDGKFTFQREDYDYIAAATIEVRFNFYMEEAAIDPGPGDPLWIKYFYGYFYKTDCEFDADNRTVEVQPNPSDKYEAILAGMDKEYDLIQLGVPTTPVSIKRQPIFQVYVQGANYLTNYVGGVYWETALTTTATDADLIATYKFTNHYNFYYIAGDDTALNPDVSGVYDITTKLRTSDSKYELFVNTTKYFPNIVWQIIDKTDSDNVVFEGEQTEVIDDTNPFAPDNLFTAIVGSDTCHVAHVKVFSRYYTNETSVGGTPTVAIPSPDIVPDNPNYNYCLGVEINSIAASSGHSSTTPDAYGKFASTAENFAGEYFQKLVASGASGIGTLYPLCQSDWTGFSLWFYYTTTLEALQESAGTVTILEYAYKIADVLKTLVPLLEPTVPHDETTAYSDFLYASSNTVRGTRRYPLITPKSNIVVGEFNKPASRATITLGDVLNLLKNAFNAYWDIYEDSTYFFRVEHKSFYDRGGDYSTSQIGADLTALTEGKTGKNWGYKSSKFKYEKSQMPEQIRWSWMDETSIPFKGYPLDVVSTHVQPGNIDDRSLSPFTADVDFAQADPSNISLDGFFVMDAIDNSGDLELPFYDFDIVYNEEYKLQNGYMSLIYLVDTYFRHSAPASSIKINDQSETATTVERRKLQEITFPSGEIPDPLKLITTGVGTGKIEEMTVNASDRSIKLTIRHDTE